METFLQVSSIVLVGTAISNMVCFTLWSQSATDNLQANMTKTLDSFSTLLGMTTNSFLLEESIHKPSQGKLQQAVQNHQSSFTGLKKALSEAQSERFMILEDAGSKLAKRAYEDAVDSLTRLAQHLSGLRSGARLQYDLTKARSEERFVPKNRHSVDDHSASNGKIRANSSQGDEERFLQAAADMFGVLIDDIGPPLKALSVRVQSKSCPCIFMPCSPLAHYVSNGLEKHLCTVKAHKER